MHSHTTPRILSDDPIAARIAELSEEYLTASADKKDVISDEIAGLISGVVVPMTPPG